MHIIHDLFDIQNHMGHALSKLIPSQIVLIASKRVILKFWCLIEHGAYAFGRSFLSTICNFCSFFANYVNNHTNICIFNNADIRIFVGDFVDYNNN